MSIEKIKQEANEIFEANCMSERKTQNNVFCRIAIANFIKEKCEKFTATGIGKLLKKDHATILHYFKMHKQEIQYNPNYKRKYCDLQLHCPGKIFTDYEQQLIDQDIVIKTLLGEKYFQSIGERNKLFPKHFTPNQLRAIADFIEQKLI